MLKRSKTSIKRIKKLVIFSALIAVISSVSTYAWFIGMQTVNVSSFDIEIASTDSLLLSLDGSYWDTTVSISQATLEHVSYPGHTNSWGGSGLVPMSSIGAMDTTASRMKLFEKASLTSTPGGYRLLASRVDNYNTGKEEQGGYVAFDLFIKNITGTQYIKELREADEEAIYLSTDSFVKVSSAGVPNTGIENSVRVAFAQIGRVIGTTNNQGIITGISCTSSADNDPVTGICRTAQIWEPNDTKHVDNAISWYNTACKERTLANVTDPASYGSAGSCSTITNGNAYNTYAVSTDIGSVDNVDVYDGADYNTYTGTSKLVAYDYFTDTEKDLEGTDRPTFMTLAPNSITKVRIYIYIEGQDVDNYDFASIGKKIAVNFGFTKQRFNPEDIEYDGPDITPPVITLNGLNEIRVAKDSVYTDLGASATDNKDASVTVTQVGIVDTSAVGIYTITYSAVDAAGNQAAKVIRTVIVE